MEGILITVAWIGNVLITLGCVIYGAVMWNRGGDDPK